MDIDESWWILEFLLRQSSVDDRSLDYLIRVLPLPNNNPRLKKRLLLRKIDSDIDKGTISEVTLEHLELIEELDFREGDAEVSEAMKAAYCTVAMHCAKKLIEENAGDKKDKCASAVRRIWSGRLREMESRDVVKRVGLFHDYLVRWINDTVAGGENLLEMFEELDVSESVRRYVNEAKEKMGPSFLELACQKISSDDELSKIMGFDQIQEGAPTVVPNGSEDLDANANNNSKVDEALRAHLPLKLKHVDRRGAKIVDPTETSCHKYDIISSAKVKKVLEAFETSAFELHAVVKDPLVDALRQSEGFKASASVENKGHDDVVGTSNMVHVEAPGPLHDRKGKTPETSRGDGLCTDQWCKRNFMERNTTAHTLERSDSADDSKEGSPIRPHLPTPKKRTVSPLNIYKPSKLTRQTKKRRWTNTEEQALRDGVMKYGRGNWKLILTMNHDVFQGRTEVNLKDKWRNMMCYSLDLEQ